MTETSPLISVTVSTGQQISEAFDAWMATLPANTARAYRQSWSSLMKYATKTPEELERSDVAKWMEYLQSKKVSGSTINQRLAGISSFYKFLNDGYGLKIDNPAAGKSLRSKRYPWQGAHYLDPDGVKGFLSMINPYTPQGSRDYALFICYLFTGRRNSEIRNLRWGDIESTGGDTWYHWQGKGKARKDLLPEPVIAAIYSYLKINHRLDGIQSEDYVFTAMRDCTSHLNGNCARANINAPLSARQIGRLLNKYLNRSGVQTHFRVHDLRHTAAMLRKSAGEDIESICDFLDQSNINTTRLYLHALEGHADKAWRTVGQMLGIDCETKNRIHKTRIPHRY